MLHAFCFRKQTIISGVEMERSTFLLSKWNGLWHLSLLRPVLPHCFGQSKMHRFELRYFVSSLLRFSNYSKYLQQSEELDYFTPVEGRMWCGVENRRIFYHHSLTHSSFLCPWLLTASSQEGRYPHHYWTQMLHLSSAPGQKENMW